MHTTEWLNWTEWKDSTSRKSDKSPLATRKEVKDYIQKQISVFRYNKSVQSHSPVQLFVTRGLQHARPPCPAPTPGVYSDSCPFSQWCHSTVSCSVDPFSSHLQSFPATGSFQMSHFFALGGQSIGVSASASDIIG